jgi:hypothetical protein
VGSDHVDDLCIASLNMFSSPPSERNRVSTARTCLLRCGKLCLYFKFLYFLCFLYDAGKLFSRFVALITLS